MQSSHTVESLLAQLATAAGVEPLQALLELAKVHHGLLPVASVSALASTLAAALSDAATVEIALRICQELLPDSGPEIEAHFLPILQSLFEKLGWETQEVANLAGETILKYAEKTRNLEQVFTAGIPCGLRGLKWQGRMRSVLLVEPLLKIEPEFLGEGKNAQKLVETLILLAKDSSIRVQSQAKSTVVSLSALIPNFPRIVESLGAATFALYEAEIANKTQHEGKILRGSLTNQEEERRFAYQSAATDRTRPLLYESQTAPNGLEFGFVPMEVMVQLREAENWRTRANAVHELESLVCLASDDAESISPFLGAFVRFVKELLLDTNLKVTQSTLSIVSSLLRIPGLSKRANASQLIPSCLDKLGDNKIAVRQAAFKVFRGFLTAVPPRLLFPHLLSALSSSNWHIREAVLHVMMAAMLADTPDYEFDFCSLIEPVAEVLEDTKPKVAFTAMETLAVVAHVKGNVTVLQALQGKAEERHIERLENRLAQETLPALKDDYIEFPKAQPTSAPLISSTQPLYSPEQMRRSMSPLAPQKDANSSNSTEDTSLSPGFRFGVATDSTAGKPDCDLPALRQPYLPINMSTKGGGSRRVSYGYQIRSSLAKRHPLLRFNLARPGNNPEGSYFPSPIPTRRKAGEIVSVSDNSLYAPLERLDPVENPGAALQLCLAPSQEWSVQFEMLNMLRRLVRHHAEVFQPLSNLHTVVLAVVKLADSLRSSLCKNSLIVIKEMAEGMGKDLDGDLEVICALVTRKCGDTNVFISEEAELALLAVCQHCSENRVIIALLSQASVAKVSVVKAKISLGFQHVLRRCAQNTVRVKDLDRLFVVLAGYLTDASADVRSGARSAFSVLRLTFHSEVDFEKVLFRSLPDKTAKEIKGSISEAKPTLRVLRSQSSRRASSPFKPLRTQRRLQAESSDEPSAIQQCAAELCAGEWKTRFDALNTLAKFIAENASGLRRSPQIMTVVDLFTQAVGDKNMSVSLHALDSLRSAIPLLAGSLEPHLALLLRALSGAMASSNSAVRDSALQAIRQLLSSCDSAYAVSAICTAVTTASVKAKPQLVAVVSDLLPTLKTAIVKRYVLPLAYKLMDDGKLETRTECFKLLQLLYQSLGSAVVESAPSSKLQKVLDLINE